MDGLGVFEGHNKTAGVLGFCIFQLLLANRRFPDVFDFLQQFDDRAVGYGIAYTGDRSEACRSVFVVAQTGIGSVGVTFVFAKVPKESAFTATTQYFVGQERRKVI